MPRNNAKKWAVMSVVFTLVGVVMTAAGIILNDYDYYWTIMVGLVLGLTFFICFWIFLSQARRLARLFNKQELLAYWTFDPVQQQQKAADEFAARKKTNKILLTIIAIFFVIIGGLFLVFGFDDLEDASLFLIMMFSILALIFIVALVAPGAAYRRMIRSIPAVYVGPFSAWVMGEYVQWKAPLTRIDRVEFVPQPDAVIAVHYDIRQRYGYQSHICRIPVPAGCGQDAWNVAVNIAAANQVQLHTAENPS